MPSAVTLSPAPGLITTPDSWAAGSFVRQGLGLWTVDADRQGDAALRLAASVLDEGERRRAADFRREADRRCYVTAHVALRLALGSFLGRRPAEVRLVREPCPTCGGPHGRPATPGGRVHFSLSHSGSCVLLACAVTPVGVDVEAVASPEVVDGVSGTLHPAETAELAALPDTERPAAFTRVWTRKEAYLKGIGTGLSRDPSLDHVGTGHACVPPDPAWEMWDVGAPDGYAAALAVRTPAAPAVRPRPGPRTDAPVPGPRTRTPPRA